jgi:hypothetical protein
VKPLQSLLPADEACCFPWLQRTKKEEAKKEKEAAKA